MIGKEEEVIDATDFAKGISSSPHTSDGGFSPIVGSFNLTYEPGVLHGVATLVDKSTNMSGEAIAHTVSDGTGSYPNGFILTDNGTVLGVDASQNLTASSALTGTYQVGTSDITNFFPSGDASKLYITSTNDIARMNVDLSAGDPTWYSVTLGKGTLNTSMRHPMIQFLDYVFVGNGNTLVRIESSTSATAAHLTLPQQNQIVALGIDAGTGRMLISTTQGSNYSGTRATTNKVFIYDGRSALVDREIPVETMITSFRNAGGITFVGAGRRFGYWNGSGITFLRTLQHATNAAADFLYKHHITVVGNTVCMIDGLRVLAYGEVLRGSRVFYYIGDNTINSNNLSLVTNVGDEKLGLGFATSKFYTLDTKGTGTGTFNSFPTNRISFPRPVNIRQVYIEYASGVANLDHNRTLYYRTSEAPTTTTAMDSIFNDSGGTIYENKDVIGVGSNPTRAIQLYFAGSSCPGIKRFIIYYDPVE
jgi:hypothetical protein